MPSCRATARHGRHERARPHRSPGVASRPRPRRARPARVHQPRPRRRPGTATTRRPRWRRTPHAVLDAAWRAGIRYFDAARSYGRAEAFLAAWLGAPRDPPGSVTVGSKWGYTYTAGWRVEAEHHEVKDHSLRRLRAPARREPRAARRPPDLYQIHSATLESGVLDDPDRARAAGRRCATTGLAIGLTLSGPRQAETLRQALEICIGGAPLFDAVQATWNLLERSAGAALRDAHAAGIGVIVKEGLANGRLTARNEAPELDATRHRGEPSTRAGTTLDALALAAVLAQPWVDVVLSGAADGEQLPRTPPPSTSPGTIAARQDLQSIVEPPGRYWATRATAELELSSAGGRRSRRRALKRSRVRPALRDGPINKSTTHDAVCRNDHAAAAARARTRFSSSSCARADGVGLARSREAALELGRRARGRAGPRATWRSMCSRTASSARMSASVREPLSVSCRRTRARGVGEAREHAHLLVAQARDVLAGTRSGSSSPPRPRWSARSSSAVRRSTSAAQRVAPADRASAPRASSSRSTATSRRTSAGLRAACARSSSSRAELAAQIDHAGRGAAQRLVLLDALVDRRLVDRLGIAALAAADPLGEHAARRQIADKAGSGRACTPVLVARPRALSSSIRRPISSAVMPSSRIFCWRFWRYMPISSAALLMLPPWRRSAVSRKSRSKASTTAPWRRGSSTRRRAGAGRRGSRTASRPTRRAAGPRSRSPPPAQQQRLLDRRAQLAHVALPLVLDAGAQRRAAQRLDRAA